jgi:hypothetical protein
MTSVTLNGRHLELAGVLPLTLGDWQALKKLGVTPEILRRQEQDMDADILSAYVVYVLRKADRKVTPEEVGALTMGQLGQLLKVVGELSKDDGDRPFSAPSTPSPLPTGGASETSRS